MRSIFLVSPIALLQAVSFLCEVPSIQCSLIRNVGRDAVLMWNRTSGSIAEVRWGLLNDAQLIKPQFIYINKFANVPVYSSDLDTPVGSAYKGRVSYVGDLSAGRAWFKITNLSISDTKKYAAKILEGNVEKTYEISLIVAVPPQFNPQPPQTKCIAEGQDLSLPCTAIGPPTPNITWVQIILGHVIKSTGTGSATLTISNIRRDQNGTYECQAWNNPNEKPVIAQTLVNVYYPSQTTVTPVTITVVQGSDIFLSCTAIGNPPPSISWIKAEGVIKAGHAAAGRTLRIPDAIKTDAGRYICTAKNTYDSKEHVHNSTATVIVIYPPSIIYDKFRNRTVNETESLSITCDADGYPTPTIKWKTPSGSIHTGQIFHITSVRRSDAGTYTCTANNGIGREAIASLKVTIHYKPIIDKSRSSSKFRSWYGNAIRLQCFATGLPSPQISWYKPTSQHITTGVNIVPGGSEVTVLTTTYQGDYGPYKCRATNILGSDEHTIYVTKLVPPGPVNMMTITEVEASSITVRWTKPANDGGDPVTDYLLEIEKKLLKTVNTYAIITQLKKDTQYTITVYAKNNVGYGMGSAKVIRTNQSGKPSVPELSRALLYDSRSKLSVGLRWTKPDENGVQITRYTIYMKEITMKSEWEKIDDVTDPNQLEFTITKNIVYGKTYMFLVTAWNKYGESIRDDSSAKSVNTTADKATYTSANLETNEDSKYSAATVWAITAILVLSLGLNVLSCLWLMRRLKQDRRKATQCTCNQSKQNKKDRKTEIYDNELEMDDKMTSAVTASFSQQPTQTGPEYETIQQLTENTIPLDARRSNDPSQYQGLNLTPKTFVQQNQGPVYEPLRTRSVESTPLRNDNVQHSYEPLNRRNQTDDYQSLQSNSRESVI